MSCVTSAKPFQSPKFNHPPLCVIMTATAYGENKNILKSLHGPQVKNTRSHPGVWLCHYCQQ